MPGLCAHRACPSRPSTSIRNSCKGLLDLSAVFASPGALPVTAYVSRVTKRGDVNTRLEQRGLFPALRFAEPARIVRPQRSCAASSINGVHDPFLRPPPPLRGFCVVVGLCPPLPLFIETLYLNIPALPQNRVSKSSPRKQAKKTFFRLFLLPPRQLLASTLSPSLSGCLCGGTHWRR